MISEVLEQAVPVFERLIVVLEAAEKARADMKESAVVRLSDAQARIEQQLGLVLDDFDQATAPLLESVEKVQRRRRASGTRQGHASVTAQRPTPISNRGVRYDPTATEKVAQTQVKVLPKSGKGRVKIRGGK